MRFSLGFTLSFLCFGSVFAADYTWTGSAGNGKWNNAGNWSSSGEATYPQSTDDMATFPSGAVVLTDTPNTCGTVTLEAGAIVTMTNNASVNWNGLCGPGTLIKRGTGTLWVKNDTTGLAFYGSVVVRIEAGKIAPTNGGEPSRPYPSGTDGTIGDATFIMAGGDVVRSGWPALDGTLTINVENDVAQAILLADTTIRSTVGSKIVKTGGGTLSVACKIASNYYLGDWQVDGGEIEFTSGTCDLLGSLSGTGRISASPLLQVRAANTNFTGTISLKNTDDSLKITHKYGVANATLDFQAPASSILIDTGDVEFWKPIAVQTNKTVNLNVGAYWTWAFGLKGPGKIVKTGTSPLILLNRIADMTEAVGGNLQFDIDQGTIQFYTGRGAYSVGDAVLGDSVLTYHVDSEGNNNGWLRIAGEVTIRTDYAVRLFNGGCLRGTGSLVKEGTGVLTMNGGLGDGTGDPFAASLIVNGGKVLVNYKQNAICRMTGGVSGTGAFEIGSNDKTRRFQFACPVTAPLTYTNGILEVDNGASFDRLTLKDARVRITSWLNPLRVGSALVSSGETRTVFDAPNLAKTTTAGSLALVLSDVAIDGDAFDYDFPENWSILKTSKRIYARTSGAANVWTGMADGTNDWNVAGNWADGVPTGSVVLYSGDFGTMNVPAGSMGAVTLRGDRDMTFMGAGLADLTFDVSGLSGRFIKRGAETVVIPESLNPATFVVAEGIVRKGGKTAGGSNIFVEEGAQFDINGWGDPKPAAIYTIAGEGPDGTGALVNNGAEVGTGSRQCAGIILSADATIGGIAGWGILNGDYAESTLKLNGYTLEKIGTFPLWMVNVTAINAGNFVISEGKVRFERAVSDLSLVSMTLGDGAGLDQPVALTVGSLTCGTNVKTDYGVYGWLTVLDNLSTTGALTIPYFRFGDGATFTPNGALTISAQADFGDDLTLDLSNWQKASGKTLLVASGVSTEDFATVVGLPDGYELMVKGDRLYLKGTGGFMLLLR